MWREGKEYSSRWNNIVFTERDYFITIFCLLKDNQCPKVVLEETLHGCVTAFEKVPKTSFHQGILFTLKEHSARPDSQK